MRTAPTERVGSNHCAHMVNYHAEQYYLIRNLGSGDRNAYLRKLIWIYFVLSL